MSFTPFVKRKTKLHDPVTLEFDSEFNTLWINALDGCKVRIQGLNSKYVKRSLMKKKNEEHLFIDIKIEE
jgi:hypothetical protein